MNAAVKYHNEKWFHNEILVKANKAIVEPQYCYAVDGLSTIIGASIRTRNNFPSPIPMLKAKFLGQKLKLNKAILFDGSNTGSSLSGMSGPVSIATGNADIVGRSGGIDVTTGAGGGSIALSVGTTSMPESEGGSFSVNAGHAIGEATGGSVTMLSGQGSTSGSVDLATTSSATSGNVMVATGTGTGELGVSGSISAVPLAWPWCCLRSI